MAVEDITCFILFTDLKKTLYFITHNFQIIVECRSIPRTRSSALRWINLIARIDTYLHVVIIIKYGAY